MKGLIVAALWGEVVFIPSGKVQVLIRLFFHFLRGLSCFWLCWNFIEKINGGITMATMQSATSLQVDGMDKVYSDDLIIPPYFVVSDTSSVDSDSYTGKTSDDYLKKAAISPLKAGDRVSIAPTWDAKIKYVVLQRY